MDSNVIKRTFIQLEYHGKKDGLALQDQLTNWCKATLLKNLEDELATSRTHQNYFKIDRLDIDIQIDARDDWMELLAREISAEIKKKVDAVVTTQDHPSTESESTAEENSFEAFFFFLQNGQLPWWSDVKSRDDFHAGIRSLLNAGLTETMKAIVSKALQEEAIQQRIVYQLPDDEFFLLIKQLIGGAGPALELRIQLARDACAKSPPGELQTHIRLLKRLLIRSIAESNPATAVQKAVDNLISNLNEQKPLTVPPFPERWNKAHQPEMEHDKISFVKRDSMAADRETARELNPDIKEGIYITDAGLVIVAAFLPAFFKKLQLLNDQQISDVNVAVCLVHYLLTGREHPAEFELGISKLLCGLEIDAPVDTSAYLSDAQKFEANELLLSVIEYWQVLKDTSVEGLRESFLQRNGKLSFHDREWLLQVEQKGYDMLLQNLPWNISMIKLPWMNYLLKTEWVF
jgi:hypothetical protein